MVKLVPYKNAHFEALASFRLDETQSSFTASVYQNIVERKIQSIPGKFPVTILYDEIPVGFFILDNSHEKMIFTQDENAVLLRSLSLNPEFQGRGIGTQAMNLLDNYFRSLFPANKSLFLTVNFKNQNAYNLYIKTGFIDEGKVYEGEKGPQHIMVKKIK